MSSETIQSYILQELEGLKKSSSILHSFLENPNYGVAIITSDFHLVETNSKMREWFPRLADDAFPLCYAGLFSRSGTPCPACPAVESIRTGRHNRAVIECRHPERGDISYRVSCAPLKSADGQICGILEIAEDVTADVRQEREHRDREIRYRNIIENASDVIIIFTLDGTILEINDKARQLFGYMPEEVVGKSFVMLLPEDKREEQLKSWREFLPAREAEVENRMFEGKCLRKDGTVIPVEMTLSLQKTATASTVAAIIRDISERKTHEAALRTHADELEHEVAVRTRQLASSEERYRTLVETANDAIISADRQGNIIYCNRKAEEIFGYGHEAVLARQITDIAPADIWKLAQRALGAGSDLDRSRVFESSGIRKDRSVFPAEYTIAISEKEGEQYLTLVARDITERKRLEHELQDYTSKLEEKVRGRTYELTASQQTLKEKVAELSILKEVNEALSSAMDLDAVLNIILVGATSHHGFGFNRAFLFLVSDDGAYLEGRVAIGPSDSGEAQRIWSEILGKNLTLSEILKTYTNKSGEIDIHVNSVIKSLRIPLDQQDHILIRAVTAKESINVRDGYTNPQVPQSLMSLMHCNSFALIPLIAEGTVLGVLWADNAITKNPIHDHDIDRLRSFAVNASLAIQKSNLIKKIQTKVDELDHANRELRQNRDRLIRSEKLAAVGEMSATVAHGLRNPLVSIGGFARRLQKKEPENGPNRKYLQIIVEEIDRLEGILSELLDFVRPQKLHLQNMNIHWLLDSSVQAFSGELQRRGIRVVKELLPDVPLLELDGDQIKRVLHNLCKNAVDAMQEGGTLTIRTGMEDGMLKISIADTGVGIADDDVEKVFHPFFTSKSSTGLGLAVCNQIISIHGGNIKLRRQIPHGVVFEIYLPLAKQHGE